MKTLLLYILIHTHSIGIGITDSEIEHRMNIKQVENQLSETTGLVYLSFRGHIYDIWVSDDEYTCNGQNYAKIEDILTSKQ